MNLELLKEYNDFGLLQIPRIVPILYNADHERMSEDQKDILENIIYGKDFKKIFGFKSGYKTDAGMEEEELVEIWYEICNKWEGLLLAEIITPVMRGGKKGKYYGWDMTTFTWIIGNDLEEIIEDGMKWARKMEKRGLKKKAKNL